MTLDLCGVGVMMAAEIGLEKLVSSENGRDMVVMCRVTATDKSGALLS